MARLVIVLKDWKLAIGLYAFQWMLNVIWNPVFFKFQAVGLALLVICTLTIIVGIYQFLYLKSLKKWSLLVLPYFLWLIVATSLNSYALVYN